MSDPLIDLLAMLPPAEPDPRRAERTVRRSRTRLTRPVRWPREAVPKTAGSAPVRRATPWTPAVAIVGLVYVWQALSMAFRIYALR